jgi:hypothetical protein
VADASSFLVEGIAGVKGKANGRIRFQRYADIVGPWRVGRAVRNDQYPDADIGWPGRRNRPPPDAIRRARTIRHAHLDSAFSKGNEKKSEKMCRIWFFPFAIDPEIQRAHESKAPGKSHPLGLSTGHQSRRIFG